MWEGFGVGFEKTLPQVVMASYSLRNWPDQEEITEIVISEEDESTIQEPQGSSIPRSEQVQSSKRHLEV